jgi:outer membrane protein
MIRRIANQGLVPALMVLLSAVLGVASSLHAGPSIDGGQRLSLRDSIRIALERNLTIRLADRDIQTAESTRAQAFAEFLPKLSTFLDYTRKSEAPSIELPADLSAALGLPPSTSTTRISLGGQETSSWRISLQQPLFTGLAVTNSYRRANTMLELSRSRLRTARHTLTFEVVRTYLTVLRAQKAEEFSSQQVKALEAHAAQAQAFFDGGVIPKNDLLKAEVELANARQTLIRAQNQVEFAKASFNHTLGRDLNTPVDLEEPQEMPPLPIGLDTAVQTAWEQRPELQELAHAIEAARTGVSVAQSQIFPQLNVVGTYTVDVAGGNPNLKPERWEIGGVLQWRVFEGGKIRAQVSEAKIEHARATDNRQQLRERVALEVKEAVLNLREAAQKLRVAETAIAQAEEHFRISRERYLAQIATSTEVVDAEALLTQARTNYFNALYDDHLAAFALQKATGVILE